MMVLREKDVTTYCGFEMTKNEKKELTESTKKVLRVVDRHGVCIIQNDDSPESYKTIEQLKHISEECGLVFVSKHENYHVIVAISIFVDVPI